MSMHEAPTFRVSPQQEQAWLAQPDGPIGRTQGVVAVEGPLDAALLADALRAVVARHEILRTTFVRRPAMRVPLQMIHENLEPGWETLDLGGLDAAEQTARLDAALAAEWSRPLDFERGPLLHALLVDLGGGGHRLALTLSSLCADTASVEVLLADLVEAYRGEAPAGEPLQYADFSEWRHELLSATDDDARAARTFWEGFAETAGPRIPLAAHIDAPAGVEETPVPVGAELQAAVAAVAEAYGSSPAVVVQSAWHVLLGRTTGRDDVLVEAVGTPARHPSLESAIGPIAQAVPVRSQVGPTLTFAELVDRIERELADLGAYQDYLQPAVGSTAAGFVLAPRLDASAGDVRFALSRAVSSGVAFKLALVHEPHADGTFRLSLAFERSAIARDWAESLARQLERLLQVATSSPSSPIADLDLVTDEDRRLLLVEFNETGGPVADGAVHELFARCAAANPDRIAVSDGRSSLTYATLDARANQLANRLGRAGVGAGDVVALCTDRSVDMAVGLLGILKAGAAYLPLNFEHPQARLLHQLVETGARATVTQEGLLGHLPEHDIEVVCLDRDRDELDAESPVAPEPTVSLDDLVYVIYTSGSTGTPKGVGVTHRNLANYVGDIVRRLDANEPTTFGMVTAISTDLGNTAVFPALCSGGTLALVQPDVAADPALLAERLEQEPVDVLKITPSHLSSLLVTDDSRVLPRRWLVLGGERAGWDLVGRVRALADCRILNHYGPTETTVGSCATVVADGPGDYGPATVPIGKPISNTRCYVLDALSRPVSLGVPGRLFIGGAGVARGYVGQPELTAERFLTDPFTSGDGRMYDTGDRVRWLPDGTLEFLGRVDEQVKIRGFRVEPGEVEGALRSHPSVRDASVVATEDAPGDVRLVAYCAVDAPVTTEELRDHLAEWVPAFMIPSSFFTLDALPLTPSGKVDRMALPELAVAIAAGTEDTFLAPRTELEETVAGIWAKVLGIERVGVEDDFFALGGHSLLATQVVAQVRTDLAVDLPLHSLFTSPTVASLSAEIVALMGDAEGDETAKLVAELEGLSDEEAARLLAELTQEGEEAAR
jgi:amino acid adenylation domain-containing protein